MKRIRCKSSVCIFCHRKASRHIGNSIKQPRLLVHLSVGRKPSPRSSTEGLPAKAKVLTKLGSHLEVWRRISQSGLWQNPAFWLQDWGVCLLLGHWPTVATSSRGSPHPWLRVPSILNWAPLFKGSSGIINLSCSNFERICVVKPVTLWFDLYILRSVDWGL